MFNDLKTTALLCIVLIMATLLGVGALGMNSLKAKNKTLSHDLLQSQVSVEALLSSNDNQAERIKTLERDSRVMTELNAAHRKQVIDLQATHESRIAKANLIKDSTDEPTKDWANALLPADALQLLKPADCQSGDPNQNGVCVTAAGLVSAVQHP
jgi:cell division protein FtsX